MTKQLKLRQRERRDEDGRILFDGVNDIPCFASDEEELAWLNTTPPATSISRACGI